MINKTSQLLYITGQKVHVPFSTVVCRLVVTVTVFSSAPKASWVVMYAMNNRTYNVMRVGDNTVSKLFRS